MAYEHYLCWLWRRSQLESMNNFQNEVVLHIFSTPTIIMERGDNKSMWKMEMEQLG